MGGFVEPQEQEPEQRAALDVVRRSNRLLRLSQRLRFTAIVREAAQVLHDEPGVTLRQDLLHGPGLVDREDGAEDLVPTHDVRERTLQRPDVDRPRQPKGARDVVCAPSRRQAIEEPELFLERRERQRSVTAPWRGKRKPPRLRRLLGGSRHLLSHWVPQTIAAAAYCNSRSVSLPMSNRRRTRNVHCCHVGCIN